MFYVKTNKGKKIEINDENVFNECPMCGEEIQVDLHDVFRDGVDLYGTRVVCKKCCDKALKGK